MTAPWFGSSVDAFDALVSANTVQTGNATSSAAAAPGVGGTMSSPVQTARTSGGLQLSQLVGATAAYAAIWSAYSSTGVQVIRLNQASGAGGLRKLQYWTGAAWADVGTTTWAGTTAWTLYRLDFSGLGTSSGTLSLKVITEATEAVQADFTVTGLNLTSVPNIAQIVDNDNNSATRQFASALLQDTTVAASYVYQKKPDANGADNSDGGAVTLITATSSYDTSFISLTASGDRHSVKNAADRTYNGRTVAAVGLNLRLRCGATGPTQCKPYLTVGGVRYYSATLTLTTVFANYLPLWQTNPATGSAWTEAAAKAAVLEYGIEVV